MFTGARCQTTFIQILITSLSGVSWETLAFVGANTLPVLAAVLTLSLTLSFTVFLPAIATLQSPAIATHTWLVSSKDLSVVPMGLCTTRGDVEQEKKSTDQGEWLHVCDCEQPEPICFPTGLTLCCCEFPTIAPGSLCSLKGLGTGTGLTVEPLHKARRISCISRTQTQNLLQGEKSVSLSLSLFRAAAILCVA